MWQAPPIKSSQGAPVHMSVSLVSRWLLLVAVVAPVLVATLTPTTDIPWKFGGPLCVVCGTFGVANLLRNIILFIPMGAALALVLGPGRRALLIVLLTTMTVEVLQFHIPGRNPLLVDVLANFTGGALGVLMVAWSHLWLRPSRRTGGVLSLGYAGAAATALLLVAFLFRTDLPQVTYWGQWTPDFGHMEHYGGTLQSASVGGIPVPYSSLDESEAIRAALQDGGSVRLAVAAGPSPSALAPIFSIADGAQGEVLMIGADRDDLVVRIRYQADRFRLDRPDFRMVGAFRDVEVGDTIRIAFEPQGGRSCLELNGRRECGIGPRLEQGWALLLYPGGGPAWFKTLMDFGWMAGLLLPFGFFARRHPFTYAGALTLLAAVSGGLWLPTVASWSLPAMAGAFAGLGMGVGVGSLVRNRRLV